MKFSIVLSTQPASFSALAYKGEISKNIEKIKNLGYNGVELAVRNPDLLDVVDLKKILDKNNLSVPAIGTGQVFGEEGLSFTNNDKQIRCQAIERIKSHVELAAQLNAVVIIGLIRGQYIADSGKKQAEQWLIEALQECTSIHPSVKFAIEPLNRYETELINSVTEGLQFIDKIGRSNIGLLLDSFHMNIEEPDIVDSIRLTGDKIFHFHVADSNRWYPGAGHIDFKTIFKTLEEIDYNGFVSGEMLPLPDPDTSAQKTIEFLHKLNY